MKKTLRTLWKWTKIVFITACIAAACSGAAYLYFTQDVVVSEPAPKEDVVKEVIEQIKKDTIDEARKQLEEATSALAKEEERLLAEIAEREARIEQINDIRSSF